MYADTKRPARRSTKKLDLIRPLRQCSRTCAVSTVTGTRQNRAIGDAARLARNICECTTSTRRWRRILANRAAATACIGLVNERGTTSTSDGTSEPNCSTNLGGQTSCGRNRRRSNFRNSISMCSSAPPRTGSLQKCKTLIGFGSFIVLARPHHEDNRIYRLWCVLP